LSRLPSPFCFRLFFRYGFAYFAWGQPLTIVLLPTASWIAWDHRHEPHPWLVGWGGVLLTFCLAWLRTMILPVSASWVAGIVGMSCGAWPGYESCDALYQVKK
jgi:hypothetical protein